MIKLGIDFDNTLIIYDALFKKAALEKNLIPLNFPECKNSIRDYLRERGQEKLFTILQGEIYGSRIFEASPAKGMYETLKKQIIMVWNYLLLVIKQRHHMRDQNIIYMMQRQIG